MLNMSHWPWATFQLLKQFRRYTGMWYNYLTLTRQLSGKSQCCMFSQPNQTIGSNARRLGCIPPRRILSSRCGVSTAVYGTVSTIFCSQRSGLAEDRCKEDAQTNTDVTRHEVFEGLHCALVATNLHELNSNTIGVVFA
jgi:hypothetical protein